MSPRSEPGAGDHEQPSAFVTGAASGIGAAIAYALSMLGWRMAGFDLRESAAEISVVCDVSDASAVREAVERAGRELGSPSLLVTAAGTCEHSAFDEITLAAWKRMLEVHLGGTVNACRAVLAAMIARRAGCIVAVTSDLATAGGERGAHYAAAKGAVTGLVRRLAAEVAADGIRVNSVAPGPTRTPLPDTNPAWLREAQAASLPLRRLAETAEVADTVLFLAEEGTYFTGQTLSPNAGSAI